MKIITFSIVLLFASFLTKKVITNYIKHLDRYKDDEVLYEQFTYLTKGQKKEKKSKERKKSVLSDKNFYLQLLPDMIAILITIVLDYTQKRMFMMTIVDSKSKNGKFIFSLVKNIGLLLAAFLHYFEIGTTFWTSTFLVSVVAFSVCFNSIQIG